MTASVTPSTSTVPDKDKESLLIKFYPHVQREVHRRKLTVLFRYLFALVSRSSVTGINSLHHTSTYLGFWFHTSSWGARGGGTNS